MRASRIDIHTVKQAFLAYGFTVYTVKDPEFVFDFIAFIEGVTFYVLVKSGAANNETFWGFLSKKEIEACRMFNRFHIIVFINGKRELFATRITKTKFVGFVPLSLYVNQQLYAMRRFGLFNEYTMTNEKVQ